MKKAVELSPRNETYKINLANIYLANAKVDEAIALLQNLSTSLNPDVASFARNSLAQAEAVKEHMNRCANGVRRSGIPKISSLANACQSRWQSQLCLSRCPQPVYSPKEKLPASIVRLPRKRC